MNDSNPAETDSDDEPRYYAYCGGLGCDHEYAGTFTSEELMDDLTCPECGRTGRQKSYPVEDAF